MRAGQLTGPRRLELIEAELPSLEEGQVLVRLQKVSVCGSDMRYFARVLPEEQYPLEVGRPAHECAGVVEDSRSDEVSPGQRVIVLPTRMNGLSEYLTEKPDRIIALPPEGDLAVLLMCQHSGTVLYACNRIGSVVGKRVVILGQGGIGLNFTTFLSRAGAREIIVTDLLDYRLEASRKVGATCTINAGRESSVKAVEEMTHGEMADLVVEAAGTPETVNQALHLVKKQGTVVPFGFPHEEVFPIRFEAIFNKEITLMATASGRSPNPAWAIKQAVNLVEQRRLDLSWLVTHRLPLEEMQRVYTMYEEKRDEVLKVVMDV